MLRKNLLLQLSLAALALMPQAMKAQFNWPYKNVNGTLVTDVPQRDAGQQSALNLVTPKIKVVRVAFVGLGMRGPGAVERWTHIPGIEIKALCDYEKSRAEGCQKLLKQASMPAADIYYGENGYKELCKRPDIDLVYIATDWDHHFPVAKEAMTNGKHAAIEVPSAMNMHEIWELINLSEKKRLHCIMLENCCYDFFELNSLHMAQEGLFGDVIYAQGAYRHELSPFWKHYWKKGPCMPRTDLAPSHRCLTSTVATVCAPSSLWIRTRLTAKNKWKSSLASLATLSVMATKPQRLSAQNKVR